MNRLIFLCIVIQGISFEAVSQTYQTAGKVVDAETGEPLAFVSIAVNDGIRGGTTDIDGKFSLISHQKIEYLQLSYVGYYSKIYHINDLTAYLTIPLKNRKTEIGEVFVLPGENPAHRIIHRVVENRKINNPEKLQSFSYVTYNKFFVTAVKKSINDTNIFITDTVEIQKLLPDSVQRIDSGMMVKAVSMKSFDPDSSQIVSLLQDTLLVHQLLRPLLKDSSNIQMLRVGFIFLSDNPYLVKNYIRKADSTINAEVLTEGFHSFYDKYFSDTINEDQILNAVDSVFRDPAVLKVLVPLIDSVLKDTALMGKIIPHLNIEKHLLSRISQEYKKNNHHEFDIDKQHIFLMESVTERKFLFPDNSHENVMATRVSGFRDPLFVLLASQIQSFSFYKNVINIGNRIYVNPISQGSTNKYFFLIEDTIFHGNDTVFIITFQPRRNKNFEALEGVLYINTNTYAVQNVIARSARQGFLNVKIQQKYDFLDQRQWFPVQLNTEVTISKVNVNNSDHDEQQIPIGVGRTYIKNIEINPGLKRREFNHIVVDVEESAASRKNEFWDQYRIAPLNAKEIRTYKFMDSVGREANIDRYARSFFIIRSGYVPVSIFSFDIREVINYNQYEGLRLGLAVQTNHRLSEWIRPGAYFAYGISDNDWKYGVNVNFFLHKNSEFEASLYYAKDVAEHGIEEIYRDNSLFSDAYWRSFLLINMTGIKKFGMKTEFRALNYFKWRGMINLLDYSTGFDPSSSDPEIARPHQEYKITELSLGLRFAYKEKIIRTPQQQFTQTFSKEPVKTRYPTIWFQYSAGLDLLGGRYTYNRYDIKIEKSFYLKYLGISSFRIEGGMIDTDVPMVRLYNGKAAYRVFTIDAPHSFATMRMDEFFSDRYAALFFDHNFGSLLIRNERFEPEFHLISNMAVGKMRHLPEDQRLYRILEKGFFESGMMIKKLISLKILKVGLGIYYRYGAYSFDNQMDNFSFRLSIHSPL